METNNVTVKNSKGENVTVNFVQKSVYESNLKAADRLLSEKASDEEILQHYVNKYAEKGKTDVNWVCERAQIYMKIAASKVTK